MNLTNAIAPTSLSILAIGTAAFGQCPADFGAVQWSVQNGGNGHYYARIHEPMSWESARLRAGVLGGHLATVTSQEENNFVMPLCLAGGGASSWLGGKRVGKQWTWITGEPWDYANWAPGEPNNTNGIEMYLLNWINSPQWNDGGNEYPGTFIVEWDSASDGDCDGNGLCDVGEVTADPSLDANGDGVLNACQCLPHPTARIWSSAEGGNDHFYARIPSSVTWEQARATSERLGGHLATLTSDAENLFVVPLATGAPNFVCHLGGARIGTTWTWITDEPWIYTSWYPGSPNNLGGVEPYLTTWVNPGTWNDVSAGYLAHYLVEWAPESVDCDQNALCDQREIATNPALDINHDGTLDFCQCVADVVVDGAINGVDLALVINDWGQTDSVADINRDGVVAGADLALILSSWGPCAP